MTCLATRCARCGGTLRKGPRFCMTVALRCVCCGAAFTQLVPRAFAETLKEAA